MVDPLVVSGRVTLRIAAAEDRTSREMSSSGRSNDARDSPNSMSAAPARMTDSDVETSGAREGVHVMLSARAARAWSTARSSRP